MSFKNEELFVGTAEYYAKYRIGYPLELLNQILKFYNINNNDNKRLLDLGCGTGQLAIPLHRNFEEVIGIDINQDMIDEAKKVSQEHNAHNLRFITMESEKIDRQLGKFDLIVCGSAFHWMNKEIVLNKSYELLNPSGGMVILGAGSIWTGKQRWQKEVVNVIKKWLGEKRKAGTGEYFMKPKSFEDYIQESNFKYKKGIYTFIYKWEIESLLGYLYSTSFCNKRLLGENRIDFEQDIKDTLLNLNQAGIFDEEVTISYFFLTKA